jgi:hypothetical protein
VNRSRALGTAVAATGLFGLGGCLTMNPSVVDPAAYLIAPGNPPDLYDGAGPTVLLPVLDVRIDPMDRLMLVDFANDPVYDGIELQMIPGPDGAPEARVLLWRPDTVDVYDQPGRVFDEPAERRSLEALLSPRAVTLQHAAFEHRLDVTRHGLDAAVRIRDRDGREVVVEVVETRGEPRFGALIAPIGATSASPDYLPVFFLDEFALVKRGGTRVRITVDGQERKPAKLPRLMKGPASYFTRYSTRVVIAHWNERRDAALHPVPVEPGAERVHADGMEWRLQWNGDRPEVEAAVARSDDDALTFLFAPALPDLTALRVDARVAGRFVINVNDVPGVVAGEYAVQRNGDRVRLVFQPLDAWQPPIVRGPSWVSSYRYDAELDLAAASPRLRSAWGRTGGDRKRAAARGVADPVTWKPHSLLPLPVVFHTPETDWAGGAAVLHSYRRRPEGRPTVSGGNVVYTEKGQLSAEWSTDGYLADGRYGVSGEIAYLRFPDVFYGIGNATAEADRETFTDRSTRFSLEARRRIVPGLYVGVGYELRNSAVLEAEDGRQLASGGVTGSAGGLASGIGLTVARDTRDNVLNPTRGSFHTASTVRFGRAAGGDFDMTRYTLDLRRYFPVLDGHVFGLQGYLRSARGDAPFQMLSRLGGQNIMRGTYQGRYRDRHLVAAQAEYRAQVRPRIGVVAFAGAGQVADRLDALALGDLHYSVGGGLRFMINRQERMNLRFDFGRGRGASGTYITAGESF